MHTADIRNLPFADCAYDVVLSSMVIHNIADLSDRLQAIDEAVRVLELGEKLLIVDIYAGTSSYADRLRALGMTEVTCSMLDWHC